MSSSKEELTDNVEGSTKTHHNRLGRFSSKDKATSISYGHYGSSSKAGKMKASGGKPSITKHPCGAVDTSKRKGGVGKYAYRCKDKSKVSGGLKKIAEEEFITTDKLSDHFQGLQKQLQRQKEAVAKTERALAVLEKKILKRKDEDSIDRRALQMAGIDESLVSEFIKNKKLISANSKD